MRRQVSYEFGRVQRKVEHETTRIKTTHRVLNNQRGIIKASQSNELIFLRPVPPPIGGGNVEHYYHFVFDLLLPLHTLLKVAPPNVVFVLEHFGIFTNRLQYIFPGRIRIEDKFAALKETTVFDLIGMNPIGLHLTRKTIEQFSNSICNTVGIDHLESRNKILLIERLPPDQYFVEHAREKGSGATRRSIRNHDALKNAICSMVRKPFVFQNLQLEHMSFREQINCFIQAQVVIAQHGAGLANCVWMNPKSVVVELSSDTRFKHFSVISKLKRHAYHLYKLPALHSEIDVERFGNWILTDARLRGYFAK
jgi:hypothetical protein